MEPKFQTSFIPKRPVIDASKAALPVVRNINIYSTVATIIFVATLLVSLGLFGYKYYLIQQIVANDKALNEARDAFDPKKIQELIDASTRIDTIKNLLEKHIVASELLILLQQLTVKNAHFDSFVYKNDTNVISLDLTGETTSYNALAVQSDLLEKSGFFKNQVFSDFGLSDTGSVRFRYSANIVPELVSYKKVVDLLTSEQ